MGKMIYSEEDLPEPIDGVIYLEDGDIIKAPLDLGPNSLCVKFLEVDIDYEEMKRLKDESV